MFYDIMLGALIIGSLVTAGGILAVHEALREMIHVLRGIETELAITKTLKTDKEEK